MSSLGRGADHPLRVALGEGRSGPPDKVLGVPSPVMVPLSSFVLMEMSLQSTNLTERFLVGTEMILYVPKRKEEGYVFTPLISR